MTPPVTHRPAGSRRADAERNRAKILDAARSALADPDADVSMAEIARLAGVGMATLYRNFPGRGELLQALYTDEADAVVEAAGQVEGETPGAALAAWLWQFFAFAVGKRHIVTELLSSTDQDHPTFGRHRARGLTAGEPLFAAARESGELRSDLSVAQTLDLLVAIAQIPGGPDYIDPIVDRVLTGLGLPALTSRDRR